MGEFGAYMGWRAGRGASAGWSAANLDRPIGPSPLIYGLEPITTRRIVNNVGPRREQNYLAAAAAARAHQRWRQTRAMAH